MDTLCKRFRNYLYFFFIFPLARVKNNVYLCTRFRNYII